jgi:hypothetical protein
MKKMTRNIQPRQQQSAPAEIGVDSEVCCCLNAETAKPQHIRTSPNAQNTIKQIANGTDLKVSAS